MQQLPSKKRKLSAGQAATKEDYERPFTPLPQFSTLAEPSTSHSVPSGSQSKFKLQQMVLGQSEYPEAQKESVGSIFSPLVVKPTIIRPGKYIALDCEMVGVGVDGSESSLARVSLVNYHGAIILDEFVGQKERVVDYRTQWSGIRPKDLVDGLLSILISRYALLKYEIAQPFGSIQKQVSNLLKGKILVGHAVHNDLKVLLLSHARSKTRDTQHYAYKFGVCKSGRIALRDLVKQELELTIQSGEHSSVCSFLSFYTTVVYDFERSRMRELRWRYTGFIRMNGKGVFHVICNFRVRRCQRRWGEKAVPTPPGVEI